MSNFKPIGAVKTPYGDATILVGRYVNGGAIAVELVLEDNEPLATFSVNLPDLPLQNGAFCVKNWSENEALVGPMLATGLFETTGWYAPAGFVQAPVWRLKDPSHVPHAIETMPAAKRSSNGSTMH